jgi:enoyl-CoA hydratase/carnithine racemase
MTTTILSRIEDRVAIISLNRPERHNAMDDAMSAAFGEAFVRAQDDPEVRAILLRGEGRSFCTGRDTAALGVRPAGVSDFAHVSRSQKRKFNMLDCAKPVICAIRGYAIGGGLELALHADIRIASETAQMSLPEIDHGIITDGGGSSITAVIAGPARAKYLLMTGDRIDAAQALQWGLVEFVVPDEQLDDFALGVARKIAGKPPIHLAVAKQLVDSVDGDGVRRGIKSELLAITALYKTEDRQEAKAARIEKRPPAYKGL